MAAEVLRAREVLGAELLCYALETNSPLVIQGYVNGYLLAPERASRMRSLDKALGALLKDAQAPAAREALLALSPTSGVSALQLLHRGDIEGFESLTGAQSTS